MLGSRKIVSLTYMAGAEDGMTPLAADGYVAELTLPPLLADALQRPVAAAVHTSGEEAAFGAVVTLVAHVTSVMDNKIQVPSHQAFPAINRNDIICPHMQSPGLSQNPYSG